MPHWGAAIPGGAGRRAFKVRYTRSESAKQELGVINAPVFDRLSPRLLSRYTFFFFLPRRDFFSGVEGARGEVSVS